MKNWKSLETLNFNSTKKMMGKTQGKNFRHDKEKIREPSTDQQKKSAEEIRTRIKSGNEKLGHTIRETLWISDEESIFHLNFSIQA